MKTAAAMAVVLEKRYKCKADKKSLAKEGGTELAYSFLEALAVEAAAIMYLAMLNMAKKNFVRGAYLVRKSWKVWEATNKFQDELVSNGFKVPEALSGLIAFGVGFFFFFISLVPEHIQFIVKLLGFQGDRAKATELLSFSQNCLSSGKSVESALMLFILKYWFLDERGKETKNKNKQTKNGRLGGKNYFHIL